MIFITCLYTLRCSLSSSKKLRVQNGLLFLEYWEGGTDIVEGCEVFKSTLTSNTIAVGNVCLLILSFIRKMTSVGTEGSRCLWAYIDTICWSSSTLKGNQRQERVSSDHAMRSVYDWEYKSNSCLEQEAAKKLRYGSFSTNWKQSKCMDQRIFELDQSG